MELGIRECGGEEGGGLHLGVMWRNRSKLNCTGFQFDC